MTLPRPRRGWLKSWSESSDNRVSRLALATAGVVGGLEQGAENLSKYPKYFLPKNFDRKADTLNRYYRINDN